MPDVANLEPHFFTSPSTLLKHKIAALLVGGSIAYKSSTLGSLEGARDWDGLILVESREDMCALMVDSVALADLLGVVSTDTARFASLDKRTLAALHINAVRVSGQTQAGLKKSVKILCVRYLVEMACIAREPALLNVLSTKDIRAFDKRYLQHRGWQIQPVTTVQTGELFVMHDADFFVSERDASPGLAFATFGASIDLFLTGRWVHVRDAKAAAILSTISRGFVQKHAGLRDVWLPHDWTTIFTRSSRFSVEYRRALRAARWAPQHWEETLPQSESKSSACLASSSSSESSSSDPESCDDDLLLYWPPPIPHFSFDPPHPSTPEPTIHLQSADSNSENTIPNPHSLIPFATSFSCNCDSARARFAAFPGQDFFWKETVHIAEELHGASLMADPRIHGRTQVPCGVDTQRDVPVVCYPWFEGTMIHEIQFLHSRGAGDHAALLLNAEMQRAEDMLKTYQATVCRGPSSSGVQAFFCDRLRGHKRLRQFYGEGITLPISWGGEGGDGHLPLAELLSMPLLINGRPYPTLNAICATALNLLAPRADDLVVLGFGDAHGGNVLLGAQPQASSRPALLYVDYEAAGWHSPWLDIAKPLYNDVFFNLLYADALEIDLGATGAVRTRKAGEVLEVDVRLPQSEIARCLWEIKRRFVLEPFIAGLAEADKEGWKERLGHALFCCALLTRNYIDCPEVFFANLAVGVMLTDWHGWELI
ncbi:hypothetical protein FIBSPDRAFT_927977 [Athelia psychrophila]|uniref:Uncharacterized protein n=1 Tax=Athelia psychrophila TaxID=1759441 RepID=A0A166QY68_9AGAM|nr:hypothetical protein FIBSPDRAFT_927977 [Fibularhizoctonia sp. CBS 109695]